MGFWTIPRPRAFQHPSDDALTMVALVGPDGVSTPVVTHLTACSRCSVRLHALEQRLAENRHAVIAEADQAFTASRLDRQRSAVLRRIGGSRAAARILPFPAHGPVVLTPRSHLIRRWIAAAAVGGLLIGAAAGRLLDPHRQTFRGGAGTADRTGDVAAQPAMQLQTVLISPASDEAFLRDFEAALVAPRVEPLLALDALTPRATDEIGRPVSVPYN
jgi:hypothetical protein